MTLKKLTTDRVLDPENYQDERTIFSCTKNGEQVEHWLYEWDPVERIFYCDQDGVIFDFNYIEGTSLDLGNWCNMTCHNNCQIEMGCKSILDAGNNCDIKVFQDSMVTCGSNCKVKIHRGCILKVGCNSVVDVQGHSNCVVVCYGECKIKNEGLNCTVITRAIV